jgi:hypothetical protein
MDRWDILEYAATIIFIAACVLVGALVLPWY